jgi:Zn-dependent protease/CBS domain-containing protein
MRWAIRIGKPFGIPVELHVTFLLFVVWIAVAQGLAAGDTGRAIGTLVLMLLVFACVLLHELGHALAARRYGIQTRNIILLPIGGLAQLERMPEKPRQEIVVAVAGPMVNVAIAALLAGLLVALHREVSVADFGGGLVESLLVLNVWMVLFNLIPAFPMDGGRVLRALIALRLDYARATQIASVVGQGIALLFGVVGLFSGQLMLLFVALFVFLAAGEEHALVQTRSSIGGLPVHAAMVTEFVTLDSTDPLRRAVDHLMAGSQADFPVLQGRAPIGVLTRADLVKALQQHGADAAIGDVVPRDETFADPHEPLEQAMQRMRERGRAALPVLLHGELVGLVTLENISDLLLVRQALRRWRGAAAEEAGRS